MTSTTARPTKRARTRRQLPDNYLRVDPETGEAWVREGDRWTPANVSVLILPKLSA